MADENKKQPTDAPQKGQAAPSMPAADGNPPNQQHSAKPAHAAKTASERQKQPAEGPDSHAECAARLAELNDKYLRIFAEYDNYKKRTIKEKEQLCAMSEGGVLLRLLPVYEEIGLAENEVRKLAESEAKKGTLLVLSKLRAMFEKEGLRQMELVGAKLDPFRHEVAFREDASAPEGTIVRVIRNGYLYKGAILQHALVSVSSGAAPPEKKGEAKAEDAKGKKEVQS